MKILKILKNVEIIIAALEVSLGEVRQNFPILCARYEEKIIPLN